MLKKLYRSSILVAGAATKKNINYKYNVRLQEQDIYIIYIFKIIILHLFYTMSLNNRLFEY